MGLNIEVEYITDMEKVMGYGVMSMPAIVVNEKVASMGKVLSAPDVDTQIGIVENALPVANALGIECPKVAVLSAVENVTEKMPSTVSAKEIAERGVPGCVISGPLALDGAISMESVKHKAIHDPVAGQADILLVPYIEIGNVLYKACTYIAGKTMASTICGASCPVVITSRADTPDSKYYSILMAVLRCLKA